MVRENGNQQQQTTKNIKLGFIYNKNKKLVI